jgi:hypothetical protein
MNHADAIHVIRRARKLLRRGRLTHRQFALLDCLTWCCRAPGGSIVVSYAALSRLTHMARATIAAGLDALQRLGLLSRIRRRALVAWHQGGLQARRLANGYRLHAPAHHEFNPRPGIQGERVQTLLVNMAPGPGLAAAQRDAAAALARRRAVIEAELLSRWAARS